MRAAAVRSRGACGAFVHAARAVCVVRAKIARAVPALKCVRECACGVACGARVRCARGSVRAVRVGCACVFAVSARSACARCVACVRGRAGFRAACGVFVRCVRAVRVACAVRTLSACGVACDVACGAVRACGACVRACARPARKARRPNRCESSSLAEQRNVAIDLVLSVRCQGLTCFYTKPLLKNMWSKRSFKRDPWHIVAHRGASWRTRQPDKTSRPQMASTRLPMPDQHDHWCEFPTQSRVPLKRACVAQFGGNRDACAGKI